MDNLTPYNLLVLVALMVALVVVGVVVILGDAQRASTYIAFATPIVVACVGVLVGAQNAQNHLENQNRLNELENKK